MKKIELTYFLTKKSYWKSNETWKGKANCKLTIDWMLSLPIYMATSLASNNFDIGIFSNLIVIDSKILNLLYILSTFWICKEIWRNLATNFTRINFVIYNHSICNYIWLHATTTYHLQLYFIIFTTSYRLLNFTIIFATIVRLLNYTSFPIN